MSSEISWAGYQYSIRLLYTIFGSRAMRRLFTTFFCPRIFIGLPAFGQLLGALAPVRPKKRAFIVTDKPIRRIAENLVPMFQQFGFTVEICDKAEPEPPIPVVDKIAEDMRKFEPDLIVAVGGGSAMDAAKAAWVRYEKPDLDIGSITVLAPIGVREKALLMAIPTTAGTGSEATFAFVLTDTSKTPPRKVATGHTELVPDFAVLLPELTAGMPRELTIGTGLDVLAHAFEAFTNRQWANDLTDALAVKAMKMVLRYLPIVAEDLGNMEARYHMQLAATMAGLAFSNGGAALTHSLGHALGKIFGVHHGKSVGIFIPYVLKYASRVTDAYVELAQEIGIEAKSKEEYEDKLMNMFTDFLKGLGVSIALKDLGISRSDFEKELDNLAKYAWEDPTVVFSVRPTSLGELRRIFEYAYEGKTIDW